MSQKENIYILGCGAIGLTLAACLANTGRKVLAVRTSKNDAPVGDIIVIVHTGEAKLKTSVAMVSLSNLTTLDGVVVVTAKSYANKMIAAALVERRFSGPIILLQNGLGVEHPFIESGFAEMYRCVLYATAQTISENEVTFRPIASCPIGLVKGDAANLEEYVNLLSTPHFSFHAEANIQRDMWKKVIINSVFNSICPLLDTDNGVFVRDVAATKLAEEIVAECIVLAEANGIILVKSELMTQILQISQGSQGVSISTLQDIKNGRATEISSLNLELARIAATMNLSAQLKRTELLGQLVLIKSGQPSEN
ncbi:MAG TPA: 2-dehydropantoate 2-reductase [Verrucomicrobiae bacterium]|jgi:2-dehydropantoate 2-reductase